MITLQFTVDEVNLILNALQELPAKVSMQLMIKVQSEGQKQFEALSRNQDIGTQDCVLIGENAGIDLINERNIVILGDGIKSLCKGQKDVLFLGDFVAIGKTIGGKPCNLFDLIVEYKEQIEAEMRM